MKIHQLKKDRKRKKQKQWRDKITEAKDKMEVVNPQIPVSTLNMNGLSSSIKKHRMAGWIKKKKKKRLTSLWPIANSF